ncbi:MAG: transposase InsO family protein [Oleiphilaceae bacterium]|jgi:transposase InsO family protein
MKIIMFITALVLLNSHSAIAGTGYYRWQDTQGIWHFSDQPPVTPATDADISKVFGQTVNTSTSPNKAIDLLPIKLKDQSVNKPQKSKQIVRQRKQKMKQEQACQTLKVKLRAIKTKLRAGYKEPRGNKLRARRRKINTKIYHQC